MEKRKVESHQIGKYFVKLTGNLLSRNFCQKCVRLNCSNFYTVSLEKNEKLSLTKNISSNQLFSKTVTFTKFLPKMREKEFP